MLDWITVSYVYKNNCCVLSVTNINFGKQKNPRVSQFSGNYFENDLVWRGVMASTVVGFDMPYTDKEQV